LRQLGSSLLVLVALSASACGENKVERGLAPRAEESTPESAAEMQKTEQQRQQQVQQEMQQKQVEEFDAAEGETE
jgi:hypothetical protein